MNPKLHPTQAKILGVLKRGVEGTSLRDLALEIGVASPNTVLHHIKQLEKKGVLRRNPSNPADYMLLKEPVKDLTYVNLYGMAQCGPQGLFTEDNVIERIPLPTKLFGTSDQIFVFRAKGESMEPYIFNNDLVLAAKQNMVENGDIAVVIHNSHPRIKKVIFGKTGIYLESLNRKFKTDMVKKEDDFKVIGKVKSVIKFFE